MKADTPLKIAYLCDMERCEICSGKTYGQCSHTFDKAHAKYKDDSKREFERYGDALFEKEREVDGSV